MHGVRIEGRESATVTTYRDGPAPALSIQVRNPPVLSFAGAALGLGIVALGVFALVESARLDPVVSGLRVIATLVFGLGVTAAALGALRPHTRLRVEGTASWSSVRGRPRLRGTRWARADASRPIR